MPSDPLPSIYNIYFYNKIFYIKENVSVKSNAVVSDGTVNPDIIWDSLDTAVHSTLLGRISFCPRPRDV